MTGISMELPKWKDISLLQCGLTCVAATVAFILDYHDCFKELDREFQSSFLRREKLSFELCKQILEPKGIDLCVECYRPNDGDNKINEGIRLLGENKAVGFAFCCKCLKHFPQYSSSDNCHAMPLIAYEKQGNSEVLLFRDLNFRVKDSGGILKLSRQEVEECHRLFRGGKDIIFLGNC